MPAAIGRVKFGSTGVRFQPTFTLDGVPIDLIAGGATNNTLGVTFKSGGVRRTGNGQFTIQRSGSGPGATNVGVVSYNPTWGAGNDITDPSSTPADYEAEFYVTLNSGPSAGLIITDNIHFGVDPRL